LVDFVLIPFSQWGMRLILRTQALQSKLEGKSPFSDDPNDYQVIVDGPAIGRIYPNPGSTAKDAQWRWTLQVPPYGHGYSATLEEAKDGISKAYKNGAACNP
jgi:hypothetical protein